MEAALPIHNGHAFSQSDCPVVEFDAFRRAVIEGVAAGGRLSALFGFPVHGGSLRLVAAMAWADRGELTILSTDVADRFPSITPDCPQAHLFEREIFEQWHVEPHGHPWLKPVRFPTPETTACGAMTFFEMSGDEVHEVAVGPVHAGVIEPGHFRFQCHGETVHHLEISLGYQHRGVERMLCDGPERRAIHAAETLAGDSTAGHAVAYCRTMESLGGGRVPARGQFLRGVALELERVANHLGDLGAMAGDVGFLPTMSYCGRIRGDVLNLTALLCGNRFSRGLIRPGGVAWDVDPAMVERIRHRLKAIAVDARDAMELLWNSASAMARFDGVGVVSPELCPQLGLVGVAARACGDPRDTRRDFPYGIYRFAHIPVSTWHTGDVFARANVRWLEVQRSLAFLDEQLDSLPAGPVQAEVGKPGLGLGVVALVEGWRGEICHVAWTDDDGRPTAYKAIDPSFHNWFGLAMAMRGQAISDFPLCNKSFNLSYCGHDL
ncbi:MAG: NADH-quinone oxidoreductase subunit C [Thermoguttaceae bacterium]